MISAVFSRQMVQLGPRYWLSPLPQPISGLWLRSMFWLLIALLELLLHAASSVQLYQGSVSFQCPSIEEQTLEIQADVKYGAVEDGVEIGASPTEISWRKPETKMVSLKPTFWTITRSKTPTNSQSWQKNKTKSQERHRIESICKFLSDQHPFKFAARSARSARSARFQVSCWPSSSSSCPFSSVPGPSGASAWRSRPGSCGSSWGPRAAVTAASWCPRRGTRCWAASSARNSRSCAARGDLCRWSNPRCGERRRETTGKLWEMVGSWVDFTQFF